MGFFILPSGIYDFTALAGRPRFFGVPDLFTAVPGLAPALTLPVILEATAGLAFAGRPRFFGALVVLEVAFFAFEVTVLGGRPLRLGSAIVPSATTLAGRPLRLGATLALLVLAVEPAGRPGRPGVATGLALNFFARLRIAEASAFTFFSILLVSSLFAAVQIFDNLLIFRL